MLGNTRDRKIEAGFTIPELIISITVIGIIMVGLMSAITYYFANMTRNNNFIEMTVNSQNFLRTTVEELRYGAGVRQSNTITDTNAPVDGWNTSNDAFVIIIAVPAIDSDRNYIIDPLTGEPYNNELVYYRQDDILFRRTLAHPDATGNILTTSCPASVASSTCPADKELVEYLDDIVFILYDQDNATTTDTLIARSIQINLTLSRDTFGQPQTLNNTIRTTMRNQFE